LVVYVPKNIEFETIRINAGAGKNYIDIDGGIGEIKIDF